MQDLRDILRQRQADGSRQDGRRLVLCMDSGGMKGAVLGGMAEALDDLNLIDCFDGVYGTSSGALVGAYTLAGQRDGASIFWRHLSGHRFIRPWLTPIGGAMHMNYLFDTVLLQREPLDSSRLRARGMDFHPLVANATYHVRDASEIFDLQSDLGLMSALRAAVRVPIVCTNPWARTPDLWWDAGLHEPVPFQTPRAQGATHLLLLRSAPRRYRPTGPLNTLHELAKRGLARPITGLRSAGRHRQDALIERQPRLQVQQLFPPLGLAYSFFCHDPELLQQYAQAGRQAVEAWWQGGPAMPGGGW